MNAEQIKARKRTAAQRVREHFAPLVRGATGDIERHLRALNLYETGSRVLEQMRRVADAAEAIVADSEAPPVWLELRIRDCWAEISVEGGAFYNLGYIHRDKKGVIAFSVDAARKEANGQVGRWRLPAISTTEGEDDLLSTLEDIIRNQITLDRVLRVSGVEVGK